MWESTTKVAPREREPTEEEKKKEADDLAKLKADWLKKTKKKKWTEDDEKQLIEKYRTTTIERVSASLAASFEGIEVRESTIRSLGLL